MFEHDTRQRFWAHGFMQCPFATKSTHELSFAAEETAMKTKVIEKTTKVMKSIVKSLLISTNGRDAAEFQKLIH